MPRFVPIPDPSGALGPPRRFPPTALATATPEPEPQRSRTASTARNRFVEWRRAVLGVLEIADEAAAAVRRLFARIS